MICSRHSSLSQYFFHPTLTVTEWRELQNPLCYILDNWDRIERELSSEVNFDRVRRRYNYMYEMPNDTPDTTPLLNKMSEFSHLLEKTVNGPRLQFSDVPYEVQTSEFWENLFQDYQELQKQMLLSTDQIIVQLNNMDSAMVNVTLWSEVKRSVGNMLNALSSQMTTLANRGPASVLQLRDDR